MFIVFGLDYLAIRLSAFELDWLCQIYSNLFVSVSLNVLRMGIVFNGRLGSIYIDDSADDDDDDDAS